MNVILESGGALVLDSPYASWTPWIASWTVFGLLALFSLIAARAFWQDGKRSNAVAGIFVAVLVVLVAVGLPILASKPAKAADSTVAAMTAASALAGSELLYVVQGGADRKGTPSQLATYVYGLMSGDCTVTTSVITCTKTNGTAFGALATVTAGTGIATALAVNVGSAGAPVLFNGAGGTPSSITLTNGTGLPVSTGITGFGANVAAFLATPTTANFAAAVTGETGTGAVMFGTAPTMSSPTINTATTFGFLTGVAAQCLHVDTSGVLSGTGSDCGSSGGSGTVTSVATSCGTSGGPITTTGTITSQIIPSSQTGTNYPIVAGNCGQVVNLSNGSNQIPTIAQAGTTGFASGYYVQLCNQGAGTQTITPATSTIGGAATYVLPAGTAADPVCVGVVSDGTNYQVVPGFTKNATLLSAGVVAAARGGAGTINGALKGNGSGVVSQAACADLSNGSTGCSLTLGSNVGTAAAAALSAAGGLSTTVASGTSALGTSAISSAACATVVTTSATNTATTDVVWWGFNGDPTGITGYAPLVAGMLTIISYPSANNVNFKVCNNTSSSITPGAITLNWRIVR